ncbi:MAG: ethanolamine utilization protein EutN [Acidobacteriota bacterium]|jgi:microcompartment protein CcmK/EutM|nr:MAG: ethanolamine utilization protein EutN [Acidobacteriota bacterium]|tara:strand:- start:378 stop:644 length:267 start_codon:yes stop_codon:yes gene_type:complete
MRIGRVTGALVSTQKHEKLDGAKLLLVQPIDADGHVSGVTVLAVDAAQAGVGDTVLLVMEGRAAGQAVRRRAAPVDTAIVGVIDSVTH